ncbi:MAG: PTS transporter subunit EIIC [Chlamydiia bacterium]|nr:PTS transporter subunit EIIC [Chlamydiia bacterium]
MAALNLSDKIHYTLKGSTVVHAAPAFEFISDQLGLRLGRFTQGKYGFMQFALPAAGLAMILAAPKETRKQAIAVVFPAALTSFLTGITEPIEFTFVFLAPALF